MDTAGSSARSKFLKRRIKKGRIPGESTPGSGTSLATLERWFEHRADETADTEPPSTATPKVEPPAFSYRLYLMNGEDIGTFTTVAPDWKIGDEFRYAGDRFAIVDIFPLDDNTAGFQGFWKVHRPSQSLSHRDYGRRLSVGRAGAAAEDSGGSMAPLPDSI